MFGERWEVNGWQSATWWAVSDYGWQPSSCGARRSSQRLPAVTAGLSPPRPRAGRPTACGSAVAGDGNELAAVDVIVGDKAGPAGAAFAAGLASQRPGHPAVVAVLQPNVAVKPSTLLVTRVTLTGEKGSVQFFDPVQQGVARAVVDSVAENVIAGDKAEELVIVMTVFVHTRAEDKAKLFKNYYEAAKAALKRAMAGEPSAEAVEKVRRKN